MISIIEPEILKLLTEGGVIVVYLIAFYQIFALAKKLYGGRFTSLIPPLSAGISLLLAKSIISWVTQILFPTFHVLQAFQFGLQTLQIVAGIFFVSAFYQLYQIIFATTGFLEERRGK